MYARIENNLVVEYPLYEGGIQDRFPELQFPMDTYGTPIPEGYVRVTPGAPPNMGPSYKYVEIFPVLADGVFKQTWEATLLTDEEKAERVETISYLMREKRNKLLAESDILVVSDRWDTYTTARKAEITVYRTALRDISTQEGFPWEITWPTL